MAHNPVKSEECLHCVDITIGVNNNEHKTGGKNKNMVLVNVNDAIRMR